MKFNIFCFSPYAFVPQQGYQQQNNFQQYYGYPQQQQQGNQYYNNNNNNNGYYNQVSNLNRFRFRSLAKMFFYWLKKIYIEWDV